MISMIVYHKARNMGHPVRIELISNGLLILLANHYITQSNPPSHISQLLSFT